MLGRAHLGGCAVGQALVKTNTDLLVLLLLADWLLRILSQTLSACPTKVHVQLLQGKNTRLDYSSGIGLAHLTRLCIAVRVSLALFKLSASVFIVANLIQITSRPTELWSYTNSLPFGLFANRPLSVAVPVLRALVLVWWGRPGIGDADSLTVGSELPTLFIGLAIEV